MRWSNTVDVAELVKNVSSRSDIEQADEVFLRTSINNGSQPGLSLIDRRHHINLPPVIFTAWDATHAHVVKLIPSASDTPATLCVVKYAHMYFIGYSSCADMMLLIERP